MSVDQAKTWNKHRENPYSEAMYTSLLFFSETIKIHGMRIRFMDLVGRYEEPDASRRWDQPLFTVVSMDEQPPFEAIWNAMMLKQAPKPHDSTIVVCILNDTR